MKYVIVGFAPGLVFAESDKDLNVTVYDKRYVAEYVAGVMTRLFGYKTQVREWYPHYPKYQTFADMVAVDGAD